MNDHLPPDPGPYGADTDDAVSALIDGELAGFAADLGLDPAAVAETLQAWGGLPARKARLEAARAAMQTPITLDDPTRAAMVAAAMAVEPDVAPVVELEPRRRRTAAIIGRVAAAAAVLLVAVGAIGLYQRQRSSGPVATRAPEPTTTAALAAAVTSQAPVTTVSTVAPAPTTTVAPAATALGDITDRSTLLAKVQREVPAVAPSTTAGFTAPPDGNGPPTAAAPPTGTGSAARGTCEPSAFFPPGATTLLDTTGLVNGKPARVIVGRLGNQTYVYVLDPDACSVLSALVY